MTTASIETVPLCTIRLALTDPFLVGDFTPGTRLIFEVAEGTVEGDRLRGVAKGAANADWLRVAPGGVGQVDVRFLLETHDGALVFVQYQGRTDLNQAGAAPIFVAPTFETGDERYTWLNGVQAVGKGTLVDGKLTYEVFEVR